MSGAFKFHHDVNEVIPWKAKYSFPSQMKKMSKRIVKITPKTGPEYEFAKRSKIQIDLPADGYLNTLNSFLCMDLRLSAQTMLQEHGVHSLFNSIRLTYGNMPIEEIYSASTIAKLMIIAGASKDYTSTSGAILEGLQGPHVLNFNVRGGRGGMVFPNLNARESSTEALSDKLQVVFDQILKVNPYSEISELNPGPLSENVRRFCFVPILGLLNCKKLIPLKWMASTLTIELMLEAPQTCLLSNENRSIKDANYWISNISYVCEIMDFDSTYDAAFVDGLREFGVPLKFASWHTHTFNIVGSSKSIYQLHDRSRSIKSAYAVIRDYSQISDVRMDPNWFYHAAGATFVEWNYIGQKLASATPANEVAAQSSSYMYALRRRNECRVRSFQYRLGGTYYPAQPVDCTNGGSEAYIELTKALNTNSDYTTGTLIHQNEWSSYGQDVPASVGTTSTFQDWEKSTDDYTSNKPYVVGSKFIMATEFENTDVMPDTIAGISGEEQNDMALIIDLESSPGGQPTSKQLDVFIHYDALLIVQPNNACALVN